METKVYGYWDNNDGKGSEREPMVQIIDNGTWDIQSVSLPPAAALRVAKALLRAAAFVTAPEPPPDNEDYKEVIEYLRNPGSAG